VTTRCRRYRDPVEIAGEKVPPVDPARYRLARPLNYRGEAHQARYVGGGHGPGEGSWLDAERSRTNGRRAVVG